MYRNECIGEINKRLGFTLLEILISLGVVAVLATTAVMVLNPAEYFRQARDTRRITDVSGLNLAIAEVAQTGVSLGASTTISISVPDNASAVCASLSLPKLPTGYQYRCVTAANSRKTDGTGWVPVDFSDAPGGGLRDGLPMDPKNDVTTGEFYYFVGNGPRSYAIAAGMMESTKYRPGGANDKVSQDGGVNMYALELGPISATYKQPNIAVNGALSGLTTCTPGWNTTLNGTTCATSGFSSGYNSGVTSPAVGYHAHANPTCGTGGEGCLEYIDLNSTYGYTHRWLGISQSFSNPGTLLGWINGTKVNVRFMAKTDTAGKKVDFGLYHRSTSVGAYTFYGTGPAYLSKTLSRVGEWELIEQEFTVTSDWEIATNYVSLYLYGNGGAEGKLWIDNVEVTYK